MSRRTKGVIDRTIAGIRVSRVSSTTMFQGVELPGADTPGRRLGKEKLGAGCWRAQSGAAASRSKRTKRQGPRKLFARQLNGFLRLLPCSGIRPIIAQAG